MTKLTDKPLFWIILLILILLPFLLLSFFCQPSADDYINSYMVRNNGIMAHMQHTYTLWSGRYFSTFIACFNPLVYGWTSGYKLIPILLILLFYSGIYFFFSAIFQQSISSLKKHLASLFLLTIYLNNIPSTSECIYWMSSSLNYFLSLIMLLSFFTLLIKNQRKGKRDLLYWFLLLLLPIIIAGSNEISMLILDGILFLIILIALTGKKKIKKNILLAAIAALTASIVEIMAPGNFNKMDWFHENTNVMQAIQQSVFAFFKISGTFLKNPSFIIGSMIFISFLPTLYKNEKIMNFIRFSPFITIPVSIFILLNLYVPVTYITSAGPALRIHDFVGFVFLVGWFYNLTVLHNYFLQRKKIEMIAIPSFLVKLLGAGAIILIITDFSKEPGKEIIPGGNIFHAAFDLFYNAPYYNIEMNQRYTLIEQEKNKNNFNIEVPAIDHLPGTIYFIDITPDSANWVNLCTAQYFELNSIKIKNTAGNDLH